MLRDTMNSRLPGRVVHSHGTEDHPIAVPAARATVAPVTVTSLAAVPAALVALGLLGPAPALAAQVLSVVPENASRTAPVDTSIKANLDGAAAGVSAQTFIVNSSQTALGTSFSSGASGNTAATDPAVDFLAGERVQATVTAGVTAGGAPVSPYVWSFRTRTTWDTGRFVLGQDQIGANLNSYDVALGDLDGDGSLDAFLAESQGDPDLVWLNTGSGWFTQTGNVLGTPDDSWSAGVGLGDVDGDGDLDAVVASLIEAAPGRIWLNDGDGSFSEGDGPQIYGGSPFGVGRDVALGDVDGDGDMDVFIAN